MTSRKHGYPLLGRYPEALSAFISLLFVYICIHTCLVLLNMDWIISSILPYLIIGLPDYTNRILGSSMALSETN